ncbi:MAG: helix-turn-helix transcriptional regulator [Chloroflexota bacterium]
MSRPARTLFPKTQRQAGALGERLKAARLRRRMSAADMAARALVSRPTIRRLEAGALTVSAAVLVRVLEVLALEDDIDRIAEQDDLGHRLVDARSPRPHRSSTKSLADEL